MYSDRRGNGQKPPRTKPSNQKSLGQNPRTKAPANNSERNCTGGLCPAFCTMPTKNRERSEMCDVLWGIPGCVTKCDRWRVSKLTKNSVTYFMDGPIHSFDHVPRPLFPPVISRRPGLGRRQHEFTLPEKYDRNFIPRILFRNLTISSFTLSIVHLHHLYLLTDSTIFASHHFIISSFHYSLACSVV